MIIKLFIMILLIKGSDGRNGIYGAKGERGKLIVNLMTSIPLNI